MFLDAKNKFLKYIVMLFVSIAFFFVYGYLTIYGPAGIYNSPDEAMNALATAQIAQGGELGINIPENLHDYKYIDPRSTFLRENTVLPSGFLGLPLLYGKLAQTINWLGLIPWLTPLFAILGAWALFLLTITFFNKRIAFISFAAYLVTPAVWYYASRGMFHNVLFTSILLWGLYFLLKGAHEARSHEIKHIVISAVLIGASLWIRPSEVLWIVLSIVVIAFALKTHIKPVHIVVGLIIVGVLGVLYFVVQRSLLGAWLPGGYGVEVAGTGSSWWSFVMPFGFDLHAIAFNSYHYYFRLFWWLSIPAVLGVLGFLIKWRNQTHARKAFFWLTAVVAFFLVFVVYGNWITHDNPDPLVVTIGNAHVRYWLPLFVLSLPWSAFFLDKVSRWFVSSRRWMVMLATSVVVVFFSSQVVFRGVDGLFGVRSSLDQGYRLQGELAASASDLDLVIVDHEDKFLFPNFFVTRRWDYGGMKKIIESGFKVWYVNAKDDERFIEEQKGLASVGLKLHEVRYLEPHVIWEVKVKE